MIKTSQLYQDMKFFQNVYKGTCGSCKGTEAGTRLVYARLGYRGQRGMSLLAMVKMLFLVVGIAGMVVRRRII